MNKVKILKFLTVFLVVFIIRLFQNQNLLYSSTKERRQLLVLTLLEDDARWLKKLKMTVQTQLYYRYVVEERRKRFSG